MKKEELETMLNNGKSMLDISKELNLSLSTIRYWCKKYQLKSKYSTFAIKGIQKIQNFKYSNSDWEEIQNFYDDEHTLNEVEKHFKIAHQTLLKAEKRGLFKKRDRESMLKLKIKKNPSKLHSEETKKNMSEKRRQFLKDNPDKHSWKRSNKHISEPCEKAKDFLTGLGVNFISEFSPEIEGRFFSIDIALPDKMIALEINGQFHYQSDGSLKSYYQERHNLLESNGWKVFQIHYSACFKFDKWTEFVEVIQNSPEVAEFNYFNYIPRQKKQNFKNNCPKCNELKTKKSKLCLSCNKEDRKNIKRTRQYLGRKQQEKDQKLKESKIKVEKSKWDNCICGKNLKHKMAKHCEECAREKSRKVAWPSKEELELLITQMPMTKIGEKYSVSSNAVKKWCKKLGIEIGPMRGFWAKKAKEDKLKNGGS